MIYKWDICEGERTTAFPGSQNHHSVDPQIWASQNCFSCRFQSKWVGTATQSHWHRRKNEKEQYMRNHRNIEKFRLEGTCHLIQLFTQSKASYMGCSGTCQVFTVSQDGDFPSSGQPACPVLACPHSNFFFSLYGLIFSLSYLSIAFGPIAVHLQGESGCIFQYLPISSKITLSLLFLRLNKPSSLTSSTYIMYSRPTPILSAKSSPLSDVFESRIDQCNWEGLWPTVQIMPY